MLLRHVCQISGPNVFNSSIGYYFCTVDREHCLWTMARYIEQNQKSAKIVKKEEGYPI